MAVQEQPLLEQGAVPRLTRGPSPARPLRGSASGAGPQRCPAGPGAARRCRGSGPVGQGLLPPRGRRTPSRGHRGASRPCRGWEARGAGRQAVFSFRRLEGDPGAGRQRWVQNLCKGLTFSVGCRDILIPWPLGVLRLPPSPPVLIPQRAGVMAWGQRKIPWDSSTATAETQGTAARRNTVLETSWSLFLPKNATQRCLGKVPRPYRLSRQVKSSLWQNSECNPTPALLHPLQLANFSTGVN